MLRCLFSSHYRCLRYLVSTKQTSFPFAHWIVGASLTCIILRYITSHYITLSSHPITSHHFTSHLHRHSYSHSHHIHITLHSDHIAFTSNHITLHSHNIHSIFLKVNSSVTCLCQFLCKIQAISEKGRIYLIVMSTHLENLSKIRN